MRYNSFLQHFWEGRASPCSFTLNLFAKNSPQETQFKYKYGWYTYGWCVCQTSHINSATIQEYKEKTVHCKPDVTPIKMGVSHLLSF